MFFFLTYTTTSFSILCLPLIWLSLSFSPFMTAAHAFLFSLSRPSLLSLIDNCVNIFWVKSDWRVYPLSTTPHQSTTLHSPRLLNLILCYCPSRPLSLSNWAYYQPVPLVEIPFFFSLLQLLPSEGNIYCTDCTVYYCNSNFLIKSDHVTTTTVATAETITASLQM